MSFVTSLTMHNGHVNGHGGSPGLQRANALHCDQQVILPPILDKSSPVRPIDIPATPAAALTPGDERRQLAIVPAGGVTNTDTRQDAAKPKSRPSQIKYVPQSELDAELAKLEALSQAALAGDTSALDQLRAELDNCPHVWRHLTDLQQLVEHKLIELVAGMDPLRAEAFRKRCSELRHELLEGAASSVLVKMAASRVVMCWMFCQFLELRALEDPQDLRCVKQLEQAERRYQVGMRTFQMARHADLQLQRLTQPSN